MPDILASLGGAVASYTEYLKNLDHVAPGRMQKRQSEIKKKELLRVLGYQIPRNSPLFEKLKGGSEEDIVNTGIEDMLQNSTRKMWQYAHENNVTLR